MSEQVVSNIMSPIRLDGPYYTRCFFELGANPPTPECGGLRCDVSIDAPFDTEIEECEGAFSLIHEMAISCRLAQELGDGEADILNVRLSMFGSVSVSRSINASEEEILRALRLNAVSLFYSSARSHVEFLSSQSPLGRFTLPAIDPEAYLQSRGV